MIRTETEEEITTVTVDRLEKRNALNSEMLVDMREALEEAAGKVVVLRGSGDSFVAGADINEIKSLDHDGALEFARLGHSVADAIEECRVPVVGAIDGPCIGGGTELALACDLRFATPRSRFGEPGVKIGIFGGWGGTYRLPRVVGLGNAMDLALTGRTISATEAQEIGLVNDVVEDVDEHARGVASGITQKRKEAVEAVKKSIRNGYSHSKQDALDREQDLFASLFEADIEDLVDSYLSELD